MDEEASVESPPPESPPPESLQQQPESSYLRPRSPYLSSLEVDQNLFKAESIIESEIAGSINYATPLSYLALRGMLDPDSTEQMRYDESFKTSWDCFEEFSISYDVVSRGSFFTCRCKTETERKAEREKGRRYLSKAAESNYFDAPPSDERPFEFYEGFYVLYPDGPDKDDPALQGQPHFAKFSRLMLKLAKAAVAYHNFITGTDLDFLQIKKGNLFFRSNGLWYFITLEAKDLQSGNIFQCQSRLFCCVRDHEWIVRVFYDRDVHVVTTVVQSFSCVECSQ